MRVLVVDDNKDAARMLAAALAKSGHQTATAHDGPNALQVAEQFRPNLALIDLGLPVMDGFELGRQIRTRDDLSRTRLIAVTGYGQEHDRRRTAAEGFDAHLVKPVDIQQLSDLIRDLAACER